ncbi:MAG: MarR family transcriptional regulator [Ktedonobacteraceae bacterium]|nr:MarR family transcriptional regulator [Ktedonobacteraceae bacterium]
MTEQWVTMKVAAEKLGISASKISRWASRGLIQVNPNPFDRRSRLVNLVELREKLAALDTIQGIEGESEEDE